MKEFIKQWMLVFALVVISALCIPPIIYGALPESSAFIIKLLVATLTTCLLNLLTRRIPVRIPMLKYLIDLVMILAVILFFGWIWQWYTLEGVWIIFAMVVPVFIAAILLDVIKVRRDVEIINRRIQHRREKTQEGNANDR